MKLVPRPATLIVLTNPQRADLTSLAGSRSLPRQLAQRAQIVLACADGEPGAAIARRLGLNKNTVVKWRKRYAEHGIEGLHDRLRPGRPRSYGDERVAVVINAALQTRPANGTQWSVRGMAEHTGVSKSTVQRWFELFGVQPHRRRTLHLSNDPFFVETVRDIVGLYLDPPDKAVVLCVDAKTRIQALQRQQPVLPMGLGYARGVSHGDVRHGTTTLFVALDIATGEVTGQRRQRHRHQDYLAFLRRIDRNVPTDLDIHLVVDNHATHQHAEVEAWLARRPRYRVHYAPTYASWLDHLQRWFGIITQQAIRRGSFSSVPQLRQRVNQFVENHNENRGPFAWTATAKSIRDKVDRIGLLASGLSLGAQTHTLLL